MKCVNYAQDGDGDTMIISISVIVLWVIFTQMKLLSCISEPLVAPSVIQFLVLDKLASCRYGQA